MTRRASPADPQRRLHAFLLDQLVALGPALAASGLAVAAGARPGPAVAVGSAVALTALVATGARAGVTGRSPGRVAVGLALLDHADGRPLGASRGVLRALLVAGTGWLTAGTGWVALALSAVGDREGLGRGWPDRWLGSRVVAVPEPAPETAPDPSAAESGDAPAVPSPRAPVPRVLPSRWYLHVEGSEPVEVRDRVRLGTVDLARLPDGVLAARDSGPGPGTLLVRGGAARTVVPGRTTTLLPGDRLRVGQRWARVEGAETDVPVGRPAAP